MYKLKTLAIASILSQAVIEGSTGAAATDAVAAATPKLGTETAVEMKFQFRVDKLRDDDGKVIGNRMVTLRDEHGNPLLDDKGNEKKIKGKHPDIVAPIPVPTTEELIAFLQAGGKEAELVHEAVREMAFNAAKNQINNLRDEKGLEAIITPQDLDLNQLSFTAIANAPKSTRSRELFSEEDLTAFLEDYHNTMVQKANYEEKRVKLAVTHFKSKLIRLKNDKEALRKLGDLLDLWATKTEALEDHVPVYDYLKQRIEKYIEAEEKNFSESL